MSKGRMIINYMEFLMVPSQKLAHCKEDPIYVFPEMKLQGLILNDFNNFDGPDPELENIVYLDLRL